MAAKRVKARATLTVLVARSVDGGYYAQGVEFDYIATGATEDEAKTRFAQGLIATLKEYIESGLAVEGLFKSTPPPDVAQRYFASDDQPLLSCEIIAESEVPDHRDFPRTIQFVRGPEALPA